jgi:hypothetical protein
MPPSIFTPMPLIFSQSCRCAQPARRSIAFDACSAADHTLRQAPFCRRFAGYAIFAYAYFLRYRAAIASHYYFRYFR